MSATLLIEMGNSAWKLAKWQPHSGLEYLGKGYGVETLQHWLRSNMSAAEYHSAALASVGSEATIQQLEHFFATEKAAMPLHIARTSPGFGITHIYTEPATLGVDRWLTLLAAKAANTAAIIIDAGTAITLDAVTQNGHHLGGWIAPGLRLMQESLVQRSSRLRMFTEHDKLAADETLGTATEAAIWLGCKASLQGFTEQAVARAQEKLQAETKVAIWCTGGDMAHINMAAYPFAEQRPHLVLEGLAQWWQGQHN